MTKAGGIGLADMMYEQLSRGLVDASRSATGMAQASAFTPGAAPLLPEEIPAEDALADQPVPVAPKPAVPEANPLAVAVVYDGEAPSAGEVAAEEAVAPNQPAPEASPAPGAENTDPGALAAMAAAPAKDPVTSAAAETAARPERKSRVKRQGRSGDSGLDLAYRAKRDAGDKLGSRAIRPALQPKHKVQQAEPERDPVETAPLPGSAEALRQAVELSRTGASENIQSSPMNMNEIVQAAKKRNSEASDNVQAIGQPVAANMTQSVENAAEAGVRKVRMTTNIPRNQRTKQNSKDAIRLLNVDNTSVNSKAGQGLAAYHAAQEEARKTAATVNMGTAPAAPIKPLTAEDSSDNVISFAIPPLRGSDLQG